MACWNSVGCDTFKMFHLIEPELHFVEITFAVWFQGSMCHKRHFVLYLYTIFFLCSEGWCKILCAVTVCTHCHWSASSLGCHGTATHLIAPPVPTGLIPLAFLSPRSGYANLRQRQQYPGSQLLLVLLDLFLHFIWIPAQVLISVMKASLAGRLQHESRGWEAMRVWHRL